LFVSCVGFGGGIGLLVLIFTLVTKGDQHAFRYGINAGLLLGGIFAALLVCVLLPLDLTARLSMSKEGKYKELWELDQHRDILFVGTLKDALVICRQAILTVPYLKSVTEDPENLMIRASVGPSWKSSGERMEVEINPVAEGKWHLCCSSFSRSSNIVFDYGKNYDNVEAWLYEISKLVQTKGAQAV